MDYWKIREIRQREALLNKTIEETEYELAARYRKSLDKIKKEMAAFYDRLVAKSENGTVLVSDLYKFNRYYDMVNLISQEMTNLGLKEIPVYEKKLTDLYTKNAAIVGRGIGFNTSVNDEAVKSAVNAIWCNDGMNWSDRVWLHKQQLSERLEQGLVDCVSRGASRTELTKQIMNDFNTSFSNADRLARTELAHVQNQSAVDKYKEAGVDKFRWLTADGCCDECQALNGELFSVDDISNLPPLHPNCRCTTLALLEDL